MAKKLTQKEVEERVKNLHNNEYRLVSKYIKSTQPITLLHKKCGKTYEIKRAKSFLKENGCLCPYCKIHHSNPPTHITEEEVIKRIYEQVGNEYTYIDSYKNMNDYINIKHNKCGTIYRVTPNMFLGVKKRRCPKCGNENRGKYAIKNNYLEELLKESPYGNEYEWKEEYKNNNKVKHKILHKSCKNTYYVRPNDFQQGYLCPYCSSSKEQKEIYSFIKKIYKGKIIYNFRKYGREIDIYLPELKIGFEYNGFYWHSDKKIPNKNYHLNKFNLFKEKGIDLYFIESTVWKHKKRIIKEKLKYIIGCSNSERIYARNTMVKFNLSKDKKKRFLDNFHIQGNCIDKFNLYLVYNGKIVALMTFGFNRRNVNSNKLELVRYATNVRYCVVGGFSKLLSHAISYIKENYPEYKEIISYADIEWSRGNVYLKNGFTLDHISNPSYYYTKCTTNEYINRFTYRKSELKKLYPEYYEDNLTEFEIINKIPNVYRIWNCGNYVFKYEIKY